VIDQRLVSTVRSGDFILKRKVCNNWRYYLVPWIESVRGVGKLEMIPANNVGVGDVFIAEGLILLAACFLVRSLSSIHCINKSAGKCNDYRCSIVEIISSRGPHSTFKLLSAEKKTTVSTFSQTLVDVTELDPLPSSNCIRCKISVRTYPYL
jgi:hypothetical protein